MRRALLTASVALIVAAPAQAGWSAQQRVAYGSDPSVSVAPDGTTIAAWYGAHGEVTASVDRGQPTVLAIGTSGRTVATAGGAYVGWTAGPHRSLVSRALRGGLLSAPERVGNGPLVALAADARGDVAAVTSTTPGGNSLIQTAFRPAGGVFGTPVALPRTQLSALTVSPRGETLVGLTDNVGPNRPPSGLDVLARKGGGPVTPATMLDPNNGGTPDTYGASVTADARGRALAVWVPGFRTGFFTSVRTPGGVWSAPVFRDTGTFGGFAAATTDDGQAVIAWRDDQGRLRYASGTTASATFAAPRTLGQTTAPPRLRALRDGRIALAYADGSTLRVRRARPGGAFGAPQAAACLVTSAETFDFAGELRNGRLALRAGTDLVRETGGRRTAHCGVS